MCRHVNMKVAHHRMYLEKCISAKLVLNLLGVFAIKQEFKILGRLRKCDHQYHLHLLKKIVMLKRTIYSPFFSLHVNP